MVTPSDLLKGLFDGGWIGGVDLADHWMSAACQFRTSATGTSAVVLVPALQRMRASGIVTFRRQEVEFDVSDGSRQLRFAGAIEDDHISGSVRLGAKTGTCELSREVEARRLLDYSMASGRSFNPRAVSASFGQMRG